VNGKLVGGADIVKEMKASGDLDKLVAEALGTPAS
jgi:glutaredoxin-related protein